MKTLIQKIPLDHHESFACRTYTTPNFETNWHQHEEYELILITEGNGTALIGDYVNEYQQGDVYFLAGNLPHWFRKSNPNKLGSAIVIHFTKQIFDNGFLNTPELSKIHKLLDQQNGLLFQKKLKQLITDDILNINKKKGFERMVQLLFCLNNIANGSQYKIITKDFSDSKNNVNPTIESVIEYTFKQFKNPITLKEIAQVAKMTIPTFCRFFKRNIKKSYFDFLQEVRISHACKLLHSTPMSVLSVCYESGYNSWSHFSKQFKVVKKMTPTSYRKKYSSES
jgi:AraC-like DNA-binding protein/quercetin dioxygenase-like cupin family protein